MAKTTERSRAPTARRRRPPWWLWLGGSLVAVVVVAAVYATRSRDTTSGPASKDPGVVHVHGLGINPANGDLYAATHMGVFHIDGGKATRIADRYQDTMGFTVVGRNHFIASGHPDLREELPPLLGLLESRDAGRSWAKKSLLGKADFHALRFAHDQVWGYDSTSSTLMVSQDGRRWDERSSLVLRDFVVSPVSAEVILATNGEGLRRSEDGGRTWKPSDAPPAPLLLAWQEERELWLVTADGAVYGSDDAGESWAKQGDIKGQPEAFIAEREALYAAAHGTIFSSSDGGRTWRVFYSEGDDDASHGGDSP